MGYNEIEMAKYLEFSLAIRRKSTSLAYVYTRNGYQKGIYSIPEKIYQLKNTVDIRYNIGFERIVKAAIKNFETNGT